MGDLLRRSIKTDMILLEPIFPVLLEHVVDALLLIAKYFHDPIVGGLLMIEVKITALSIGRELLLAHFRDIIHKFIINHKPLTRLLGMSGKWVFAGKFKRVITTLCISFFS